MGRIATFWTLGFVQAASNCPEYIANPENYYRDPCPDTRPESRCNALDEYVWRKDSAILFVDGNTQMSKPPSQDDLFVQIGRFLSTITGLAYVNIKQIPNEKLVFLNDRKESRNEDSIIALTWRHFLDFPDQPEWLVRFPMVKASLRAMDMASELSQTVLGGP